MDFLTELGATKVEASLIYPHVPFYSITTCLPGAQVTCLLKLIIDTRFILNMTNAFNQMAVQIALFQYFFQYLFPGSLLYIYHEILSPYVHFFIPFNYLDLVHNIFILNDSTKQWNNQFVTIRGHFHTHVFFHNLFKSNSGTLSNEFSILGEIPEIFSENTKGLSIHWAKC